MAKYAAQLIDEYHWITVTRGVKPPEPETLREVAKLLEARAVHYTALHSITQTAAKASAEGVSILTPVAGAVIQFHPF